MKTGYPSGRHDNKYSYNAYRSTDQTDSVMSKPIELYNANHPSNIMSHRKEENAYNNNVTSMPPNGEYYTLGKKDYSAANSKQTTVNHEYSKHASENNELKPYREEHNQSRQNDSKFEISEI